MKKVWKWIAGIVLALMVIAAILLAGFWYITEARVVEKDRIKSSDGTREVVLQAVGEPDFPFGSASGKVVLYENGKKTAAKEFELKDDGAAVRPESWNVEWERDNVRITISGSEQEDEEIILEYKKQ